MLSDRDIEEERQLGNLTITPYNSSCLKPASYDVHLGGKLLLPYCDEPVSGNGGCYLDMGAHEQPVEEYELEARDGTKPHFYLAPGATALGHTEESVHLKGRLTADLAGLSSVGRWFLFVHVTAGFVDPGWPNFEPELQEGKLTLELYNASPWNLRLWSGMRIAQLRFYNTDSLPMSDYGERGSYVHSNTVQASQYHRSKSV